MGALGSNVGVTDASAVIKANEICNAYGIDVISTGGVISFVMECFEKGLLTSQDTGGLEIRFGDAEAVMKCIHLIAKREGFGKLMAEGTAKMAARVGGNAWDFAMQVKNIDPGMHEPRLSSGMGLGFMINPHGADHCCNVIDVRFSTDAGMVGANPLGFLETFPPGDISPRKVALFRMEHLRQVLYDCFLLCHLAAAPYTIEKLTEVLRAVTGWNTGPLERALTLARLFNVREGFTPDDDVLPRRYYQDRPGTLLTNPALFPEKMEKAKRYYYTLMGWDSNTGIPLSEKLNELSIPF
jgi:aldehyde:ferredoxin oxidoreductase